MSEQDETEVVRETVTETEVSQPDVEDNPSTSAQDIVDAVHEAQAENSGTSETVVTERVVESADPTPPVEGTTKDD